MFGMARKKIRRASGCGARLALQFEASELAHHADSARSGFVPGWHVVSVRRARAIGPGCKAVHARPVAAVLAACRHGEAAACEDGAHALVGVHWLVMHVELEVSAPFECGALRCASRAIHREVVHTLGSDSLCGGWLIPGPQATSRSAAAAGPYYQLASRELRGLQGDHQNEDKACGPHMQPPATC